MADPTKQPTFHPPSSTMDPTVASLLAENTLVVQSGIRYCEYVKIRCKDGIELDFHCEKANKAALELTDYVSIATPLAHSLIDSVIVNLGESLLNR